MATMKGKSGRKGFDAGSDLALTLEHFSHSATLTAQIQNGLMTAIQDPSDESSLSFLVLGRARLVARVANRLARLASEHLDGLR